MKSLSPEVLARVSKHRFLRTLPQTEIEQALLTLEEKFGNKYEFIGDEVFITIHIFLKHQHAMNVLDDLLLALIFAHRYFGKTLPKDLIQKLLNKPQTADTLFELKCMGIFLEKHKVTYEPVLRGGKVPEFKITIADLPEIYVECKSQNSQDSGYIKKFKVVSDKIIQAVDKSDFIKEAWANGHRTEIFPAQYIDDREIKSLSQCLGSLKFSEAVHPGKAVTKNIQLVCVPREQAPPENNAIRTGCINVGTDPVQLSHINTHLMVSAWDGITLQARRSQRNLLTEGRKKLRNIPEGSMGMICVQTYGALKFLPDIEKLLVQKEYNSIPLVWLNPFNERKLVCRNEFLKSRDVLFKGILIN